MTQHAAEPMVEPMASGTSVLITVTGPDRPGVSSVLFAALTRHGVDLLDVEQVVTRGQLTLAALVLAHPRSGGPAGGVEQAMASIAMQVRISLGSAAEAENRLSTHVVLVIGRPSRHARRSIAQALADVARTSTRSGGWPTTRSPAWS